MSDDGQSYYKRVLETLPGTTCPACREAGTATDEYLRRTLYGRITDRRFRAAFDAAGGFCHPHAKRLAGFSDGLAISILYETPLWETYQPTRAPLKERLRRLLPGRRIFRGYQVTGNCPACDHETEILKHYLTIIARYWDREELQQAYEASGGLCLPHFRKLKELGKPPAWLLSVQEEKARTLAAAIERYVAYCNATSGNRPEMEREDKLRWKDVLRYLYGEAVLPEAEKPPERDGW